MFKYLNHILKTMYKKLSLIFIILLLSTNIAYSAPAMWGLALNFETEECAGYWSGDEFVRYSLPLNWTAYYPYQNNIIQTEIGNCTFTDATKMEECCNQLGYQFISDNVGKGKLTGLGKNFQKKSLFTPLNISISIISFVAAFFLVSYLIRRKNKRSKFI